MNRRETLPGDRERTMLLRRLLPALLLVVLGLFACTRDGRQAGRTAPNAPGLPASAGPGTGGDPRVTIVPAAPTVRSAVQVELSGFSSAENAVYRWTRNGQAVEGVNGPALSLENFSKGDSVSVAVSAGGREAAASVTIVNSPPVITSVPFSPEDIHGGADITVSPTATDADGDLIRFSYVWKVNGREAGGDGPALQGSLFRKGDRISLTVTPSDNEGPGPVFASKELVIPNASPRFTTTPPSEFRGETYAYQAAAEDPDGDRITYSLGQAPQGMAIDAHTGLVTWTIGRSQGGAHVIEVIAQDADGGRDTQRYTLSVTIPEGASHERH